MEKIKRFEDLKVWQKARELSKEVYKITKEGEFAKNFGFKNQIRDSSGSSMDNIAEGFERSGNKEFMQFLYIVKGSTGEVRSQLYRAIDQNYITKKQFDNIYILAIQTSKLIGGLINYLSDSDFKGFKYKNKS